MASESVQRKGMAAANSTSVAIGVHIMLAGRFFAHYCASGFLSKLGRCCSFNSTADGYVRADGTNAVVVELLADTHGATAREEVLGTLAGTVMKHNGTCPSLTAPCGPAEQEAIAEAVRNAGISALDVDVCEAHASGAVLADSVEVNSLMRCHRQEGSDENLDVVAGKSATGNMVYAASLASFLRTVDSMKHGTALPTLHLAQMNPHIVHRNQLSLPDDVTLFRWGTSFGGVMARGFGGTDVYAVAHGRVADDCVAPVLEHQPLQLTFWPGGGGESEWPQPKRGYFIIGTWCRWKHPVRMHDEGSGVFGYTLTLGENGWEKFQIWIDGNPNLILYPDDSSEYKDSVVLGPDSHAKAGWIVDGRHERVRR